MRKKDTYKYVYVYYILMHILCICTNAYIYLFFYVSNNYIICIPNYFNSQNRFSKNEYINIIMNNYL